MISIDCEICKKNINDSFYVEVNTLIVYDKEFMGSKSFTPIEKSDLCSKLFCHLKCWQDLLSVKVNKKRKIKVMEEVV